MWKINRSWILLCADQDFTHCAHNQTISSCPVAAYSRYIAQVKSRSGKPAFLSGHAAFLSLGLSPSLLSSSLSQTSGSCSPSRMIPLRRLSSHRLSGLALDTVKCQLQGVNGQVTFP